VFVVGCSVARVGDGGQCELNSDCQPLLVCVLGQCREECHEDRDCDGDERCAPSGSEGLNACLSPDVPLLCSFHSDCPETARCLERECRTECLEDRDCLDGVPCVDGACEEPLPPPPVVRDGGTCMDSLCGQECVNLATDEQHCGACGAVCADGLLCTGGGCCPSGATSCDGECVFLGSNPAHCNACNRACPEGRRCISSQCQQPNDVCEGAVAADVSTGSAELDFPGAAGYADTGGCRGFVDRYFQFALPQRALVYAYSDGRNGAVGLLSGCGGSPHCEQTCMENGGDSRRILEAGTYFAVYDADAAGTGAIEQVPVSGVGIGELTETVTMLSGTTVGEMNTPGSAGAGPDTFAWFVSCGDTPGGTARISVCGTGWVPMVEYIPGNRLGAETSSGDTCTSPLRIEAAAGQGLHVIRIDGATTSDSGAFTLSVTP